MKKVLMLVLTVVFLGTTSAVAAPTYYFGENLNPAQSVTGAPVTARNAFFSNLVGVGTEGFESFSTGANLPLKIDFPVSSGAVTATLNTTSTSTSVSTEVRISPGLGRFATSGNTYLNIALGDGFTVSFSESISAFGFYGTDIGDYSGQLLMKMTNGSTVDVAVPHTANSPNGALLFWGFIDTENSYSSIEFSNTSGTDSFGFDDMTIGVREQIAPVPEPATMLLLGFGLIGIAGLRKKFKK